MPNRPSEHRRWFAFALWLVLAGPSPLHAEEGVIDLAALPSYREQPGNITNTGATLGRLLFYDRRLSRTNTVSCSSCHQQAHAFGTPALVGTGVGGTTSRRPMRLANAGLIQAPPGTGVFFWDRRALTLESVVTEPIHSAVEMGFSGTNGDPDFAALIAKLSVLPEYQLLFKYAFDSRVIDETAIQKALSQFINSIYSLDSKYDAGAVNTPPSQPFPNFTESENRGMQLYFDRGPSFSGARCWICHNGNTFTNSARGNNGVITAMGGGTDLTVTKSPSLRDLFNPSGQLNGPLMHNGAFTSLAQVFDHYSAIPRGIPNIDPLFSNGHTLNLTQQDRLDLEAFLLTLTSKDVYTDSKWSNPFRADGTITVKDSAPPASQTINLSTRMQVRTGDKIGIGGFIITGTAPKRVLVRALGPSLGQFGLSTLLADPTLTLHGPADFAPIVNESWKSSQHEEITASGLAPGSDLEPAIVATLAPGSYTAILSGVNGGTGTGILEIYDLDLDADSILANISTRAFTGTGDDTLIAGFTVGKGSGVDNIVVRGRGPSLWAVFGQNMYDPALEVRNANGATLVSTNGGGGAVTADYVRRAGLMPERSEEPIALLTLGPGAYTALLWPQINRYYNPPAIALIEVYSLGRLP